MRDESALDWLRDEMDGALLDHLAEKMLRSKGLRPLTRVQVKDFDHGAMVYFAEAFLAGRVDSYVIDSHHFDVFDTYCVDPGCPCNDMGLAVYEDRQEIGIIVADLAAPSWSTRHEGKPALARAWTAFSRRYPDPRLFRKRAKLMREAGPEIMASARPAPRVAAPAVGRNQPCPCGSGKKYKRCCLSKISPDV
jgi:hypothetical protein